MTTETLVSLVQAELDKEVAQAFEKVAVYLSELTGLTQEDAKTVLKSYVPDCLDCYEYINTKEV